jgi:hypothetical protein
MWIRKIHRYTALVMGPFLVLTSLAGAAVALYRKIWPNLDLKYKYTLTELHNLDIIGPWASALLGLGLFILALTGGAMWTQLLLRRRKRSG